MKVFHVEHLKQVETTFLLTSPISCGIMQTMAQIADQANKDYVRCASCKRIIAERNDGKIVGKIKCRCGYVNKY